MPTGLEQTHQQLEAIRQRFAQVQATIHTLRADLDATRQGADQLHQVADDLDQAQGGYERLAGRVRDVTREITYRHHSIEIALTQPFFVQQLGLAALSSTHLPITLAGQTADATVTPIDRPAIHLAPPAGGGDCRLVGKDEIAVQQRFRLTLPAPLQQSSEAELWIALGLSAKGLRMTPFPARGARLCGVSPDLDALERVFPLRLQAAANAAAEIKERLQQPRDLSQGTGLGSLGDLGLSPSFYDIQVDGQVRLFGRAMNLPARPAGRLAPQPVLAAPWDVGVKLHASLVEPLIRKAITQAAPQEVSIESIRLGPDNAIHLQLGAQIDESGTFSAGEGLFKVTANVRYRVSVGASLRVSLQTRLSKQIVASVQVEDVSVGEPHLDLGLIPANIVTDWIADRLTQAVELKEKIRSQMSGLQPIQILAVSAARQVDAVVGTDCLIIRLDM